jgi:hypothetical protein
MTAVVSADTAKVEPPVSPYLHLARTFRRSLGFSIFPCRPGEKTPVVKKWDPFKNAPPDDDTVTGWWTEDPARNIAIVTGKVSGIVVVDTDSAEAETWAQSHLPQTPMMTRTPAGVHRYYRWSERVSNKTGVRPGIDIRGDGGYVIAPLSIHPGKPERGIPPGSRYDFIGEWPDTPEVLPRFDPTWFKETAAMTNLERAQRYVATISGVPEGQRDGPRQTPC